MTVKEFKIQLALGSLSDNMKWTIANDRNTPVGVLTILSTDEDWSIRYRVAMNPNTSVRVLTKLSKDEDRDVGIKATNALTGQSAWRIRVHYTWARLASPDDTEK